MALQVKYLLHNAADTGIQFQPWSWEDPLREGRQELTCVVSGNTLGQRGLLGFNPMESQSLK